MNRIKKGYNLKIVTGILSGILLFTSILHSEDILRLPVGKEDDTLERIDTFYDSDGNKIRVFTVRTNLGKKQGFKDKLHMLPSQYIAESVNIYKDIISDKIDPRYTINIYCRKASEDQWWDLSSTMDILCLALSKDDAIELKFVIIGELSEGVIKYIRRGIIEAFEAESWAYKSDSFAYGLLYDLDELQSQRTDL